MYLFHQQILIFKMQTAIEGREKVLKRYHLLMQRAVENFEQKEKELKQLRLERNST